MEEIRSFLAFKLPGGIKNIVIRVSDMAKMTLKNVRWVEVANIHFTMLFMGNIRDDYLSDIRTSIKNICSSCRPFDIELQGMGVFPSARKPRVLWLGINGDIGRIAFFRDMLQQELQPFGISQDKRKFRPHLTLGRFKQSSEKDSSLIELLDKYRDLKSPIKRLDEFVFFRSDLNHSGVKYTRLDSWRLAESSQSYS